MFVIIFFVFGLVVGQDSNKHISPYNAGRKEVQTATPLHGILQMANGTATSLTIRVRYSFTDFPDIKWFNVHYWPLMSSLLSCNENDTFEDIDNDSKYGSKMLQVKVSEINIRSSKYLHHIVWKNSGKNHDDNFQVEQVINLFDLYPNQSYGVCIESNENTLAWCSCTEDFRTTQVIGRVRHLFFNQETESVEWASPAGFELINNISYNVCISNNDYYNSTVPDVATTSERPVNNSNCNVSNDNKYGFKIPDNVTSMTVCVSVIGIGVNSSEECVSSSDSECAKQLTINATESQTNHSEVYISLGNSDCSYDVRVVCYKVPTCKTISDCVSMKAVQNGTIGAYKFAAQNLASYKILVYFVDDGNYKLVATKEYKHSADDFDYAVTEAKMNTSISVSWIRPWNIIDPVSFSSQIEGFTPQKFNNFTGCFFTVVKKNLEPFKKYNGNLSAFIGKDDPSKNSPEGRALSILHHYSLTTDPGVCNEITPLGVEQITFNDTKDAYPTVLFRLPSNMTGKIENIHITLICDTHGTIYSRDHDIPECKSDENCSIEIKQFVHPDKNYTIEMHCSNADTTLGGIKSRISYKTDPAIPVMGRDILLVNKQNWNSRNNGSDIEVMISSELLDKDAGTIKYAVICYDKERLPRLSNGYLKGYNGTKCERNVSVELLEANKITKLKNLDFNEDYAAVLYYKNELAYTFSNILHFRTRENPTQSIVAVCMIILIFIILFILSMYFSRLEKSITSTLNLPDLEFYPSSLEGEGFHHPISKVNWKEELQELLREPKIAIKKEFFSLSQKNIHGSHPPSTCIAEHEKNLNKNRYFDIVPYDFSRVVLQAFPGKEHENYINASYIHSYKVNCGFIACQGPKESTAHDFWRMVVEKNVRVIVMLTRCVEGREKCYKYWPSVTPLITPSNTSIKPLQETADPSGDYTIRKFLVSQGWETQEVVQFHFTAWPDKKCPRTANFHSFISEVKSCGLSESSPVVVHCSAGVGRTGSFIALYNLLDEMHEEAKDFIDIYYQVLKMRRFRSYMVQTQSQYIFLYESIYQLFQDNSGELPGNESADRMSDGDLEELSEDESDIA